MADAEKTQLLNSLSDAIKEVIFQTKYRIFRKKIYFVKFIKCQLRFGGKRELATDIDGRVCFLCLKLETIFLHGLKNRNLISNLQSNSTVLNAGLNSLKNLK